MLINYRKNYIKPQLKLPKLLKIPTIYKKKNVFGYHYTITIHVCSMNTKYLPCRLITRNFRNIPYFPLSSTNSVDTFFSYPYFHKYILQKRQLLQQRRKSSNRILKLLHIMQFFEIWLFPLVHFNYILTRLNNFYQISI